MASGFSSPYYPFKGSQIAKRDFDQHFSIDLLVKDQTLMLKEAESLGVPMPGLAAIREVCQAARAQGHGQEDIAAVVKAIERGRPRLGAAGGARRGSVVPSSPLGSVGANPPMTLPESRPQNPGHRSLRRSFVAGGRGLRARPRPTSRSPTPGPVPSSRASRSPT